MAISNEPRIRATLIVEQDGVELRTFTFDRLGTIDLNYGHPGGGGLMSSAKRYAPPLSEVSIEIDLVSPTDPTKRGELVERTEIPEHVIELVRAELARRGPDYSDERWDW